jgi:molybdate transport system substrate-binding protein
VKVHRRVLSAILALCFLAFPVRGQDIAVAAAADLQFAMRDVAEQFEKQAGTKVNVSYGSSGDFYSQLQNGAPFDLFFSADIEYVRKLDTAGLADCFRDDTVCVIEWPERAGPSLPSVAVRFTALPK